MFNEDGTGSPGPDNPVNKPTPAIVIKLCEQIIQLAIMCDMNLVISGGYQDEHTPENQMKRVDLCAINSHAGVVTSTNTMLNRMVQITKDRKDGPVYAALKRAHDAFINQLADKGIMLNASEGTNKETGE